MFLRLNGDIFVLVLLYLATILNTGISTVIDPTLRGYISAVINHTFYVFCMLNGNNFMLSGTIVFAGNVMLEL